MPLDMFVHQDKDYMKQGYTATDIIISRSKGYNVLQWVGIYTTSRRIRTGNVQKHHKKEY